MDGAKKDSVEKTVTICNARGLHARAAAKFVRLVESHDAATIEVSKGDMTVTGSSLMGLLMLSASKNTSILIRASGEGAAPALDALVDLVERGFDED